MGLEMWFRDDVRNMLLSLSVSSALAGQWSEDPQLAAYRAGYQAAIGAVAVAFGLSPGAVSPQAQARKLAPLATEEAAGEWQAEA
jgi:hypothetical protein